MAKKQNKKNEAQKKLADAKTYALKRRKAMDAAFKRWADICMKPVFNGFLWDEERKVKEAMREYERAADYYVYLLIGRD